MSDFDKLRNILAQEIANRRDTFTVENCYINCEIGGTFTPTCESMLAFTSQQIKSNDSEATHNIDDLIVIANNQSYNYSNTVTRLFYEVLKRDTAFDFIEAQITGAGLIEATLIAQTEKQNRIIQRDVVMFGPEVTTQALPINDLLSLPMNGSLMLKVRGVAQKSLVKGFRWVGKMPSNKANTGERIVLLPTNGRKAEIIHRLMNISKSLAPNQQCILKRTLFLVYDASSTSACANLEQHSNGLRVLILGGPYFGAGGNASLLVSLVLNAADKNDAVSEIMLVGENTVFDGETLVRQDGFITGRKENIVSTGIIFQAANPATIELSATSWGRFAQNPAHSPFPAKSKVRAYRTCAASYSKDISGDDGCRQIARYQETDFCAFIFASFPYKILKKCGSPLPFYFGNNDAEFSLRCIKEGGRIAVNPNLQIWHHATYSPDRQAFEILHGLIIDCAYGGLEEGHFFTAIMERLSRLSRIGHYLILRTYAIALEKFAQGPSWMEPKDIYKNYKEISTELKSIFSSCYSSLSPEDAYAMLKESDFIDIDEARPGKYFLKSAIFTDEHTGEYFFVDSFKLKDMLTKCITSCIKQLNQIAGSFMGLEAAWKMYVEKFNYLEFWKKALANTSLTIDFLKPAHTGSAKSQKKRVPTVFDAELIQPTREELIASLPSGFTIEGYLAHNPDVREAKIDPIEHWINYGQYESRKY